MNCRHCQTPLEHVFVDLGTAPPSNAYLTENQLTEPEPYYPLKVFVCESCWLVQIDEFAHHSAIFDEKYAYFSSYSSTWLAHAKSYVEMITQRLSLDSNSQVVEIASNDGYLLQYFQQQKIPCLGIEPTASTARAAKDKGIDVLERFFGMELAKELNRQGQQADLIIGNNVVAHVPDINDFVSGLKHLLKPNGTITLEFPHLLALIEHCQFDTIYHEHFSYLSLTTMVEILNSVGLQVIDVDELKTHGGSLRVYIKHLGRESTPSQATMKLLENERIKGVSSLQYYQEFQSRVDKIRDKFLTFIAQKKKQEKRIAGYGAAAKGNTFLNYCGITKEHIDFISDISPHKQGLFMPGSHIPITPPETIDTSKPDYIIILPWNLKDEIIQQIRPNDDGGVRFVTAIPNLDIK